jgi:hypothetical protein
MLVNKRKFCFPIHLLPKIEKIFIFSIFGTHNAYFKIIRKHLVPKIEKNPLPKISTNGLFLISWNEIRTSIFCQKVKKCSFFHFFVPKISIKKFIEIFGIIAQN